MSDMVKLAVAAPIQVGGSLFTPEQLAKIGAVIGSDSKIEMTPFKQLYVQIPQAQRDVVKAELESIGLEVYPAGFVAKSVIACNFCKGAEAGGLEVARQLNKAIAGIQTPTPLKVGFAGCAQGTSEPLLKDIGVVKLLDTYDIYVGGDAKGLKAAAAQLLCSSVAEERVIPAVLNLIACYQDEAKGKEKFHKFVKRVTLDHLRTIALA